MNKAEILRRVFRIALLPLFAAVSLSVCASAPREEIAALPTPNARTERVPASGAPLEEERAIPLSEAYVFAEGLAEFIEKGDYAAAIASFNDLPDEEASSHEMLKLKLSILVSSGDTKAASKLADSIEAQHGIDTELLYARAVIALAENKPQERNRHLTKILELDPKNMDALLALGEDSLRRRAYGDAAKWYSQAVAADKGNTDAYRGLVHSYYLQNRMRDARRAVNRAIAEHPNEASLYAESALIYFEEKNLPKALDTMRHAISLDPESSSYWSNYGFMLVRASNYSEAREALTEAIRLDPERPFPYLYRSGVNDALGFTEEAISDYRIVCKSYPQYYFAAESLGVLLWIKGDFRGAKNAFSQALKYDDDNLSYALMYTLCCYKLSEDNEAKRFIRSFMNKLNSSSPEYFLCRLYFDFAGDADVTGRISRLNDETQKSKLLFYLASYYDLSRRESLAGKLYAEIAGAQSPTFFEYRLAVAAIEKAAGQTGLSQSRGSPR